MNPDNPLPITVLIAARKDRLLIAGTAAFVLALFLLTYAYYVDDVYIYATFARNFARGLGFTYNANSGPTYGMTSPLYVILLAPFARQGAASCLLAVKILGFLGTFGTALSLAQTYNWSINASRNERWVGFVTAVIALFNPCTMRWIVCGMELPLGLLCLAELVRCALVVPNGSGPRIALWTAMGLFVRPEFIVVYAVLVLFVVLSRWSALSVNLEGLRSLWKPGKRLLWLAVPGCVYAVWLLYAWWTFGQIQPNPVLAKGGARALFSGSFLKFLQEILTQGAILVGAPLAAITALRVVALSAWRSRCLCNNEPVLLLGMFAVVTLAGYYARNAPAYGRYLALFLPPLAGACLAGVLKAVLVKSRVALSVVLTAVVIGSLVPLWSVLCHMRLHTAGNQGMMAMGARLREKLGPEARIVAADVGVLAYSSEGQIFDVLGVVSPEFIGKDVPAILLKSRPEHFVLLPWQLDLAAGKPPRFRWEVTERLKYPSFRLKDKQGNEYLVGTFVYPSQR